MHLIVITRLIKTIPIVKCMYVYRVHANTYTCTVNA